MKEYDTLPGIAIDDSKFNPGVNSLTKIHERQVERAYEMGLLHGINAQSMAQVKNDVMEFDDYGWET